METNRRRFLLTHFVLYAKGWYEQTDDIYADLKKILELDGFTPETKMNIFNIVVKHFENADLPPFTKSLSSLITDIDKEECWKLGYWTKESKMFFKGTKAQAEVLPEYDSKTALLYYIRMHISLIREHFWNHTAPDYQRMKRPKNITLAMLKQAFPKPRKKYVKKS